MSTRVDGWLLAHYRAPLTLDLVWDVWHAAGGEINPDITKETWRPKAQEVYDRYEWRSELGCRFPASELGLPWKFPVELPMSFKQSPYWKFSSGRREFPLFHTQAAEWFRIWVRDLDVFNPYHMEWVIQKARRVLPCLQADYVFADHQTPIARWMGLNPREMMWPLVYFPPDMVDRIGQQKFAAAPVYSVEEDPALGGGVWVQVTANPFTANKSHLRPAAKHFGLKVPR